MPSFHSVSIRAQRKVMNIDWNLISGVDLRTWWQTWDTNRTAQNALLFLLSV